jgi:16S rRNA (adenine(1408)-N(1))-methyltransferase
VHVDLGTGDGRYALQIARKHPDTAVIGLDTCLDHLRAAPKRHPANLRFVMHDAADCPPAMLPVANTVTVNFPYGSLLRGLVAGNPALLARLDALLGRGSALEVRMNTSALIATGLDAVTGPESIAAALRQVPGLWVSRRAMAQAELRAFPSSWAKRLGYGKPTDAWLIAGARSLR